MNLRLTARGGVVLLDDFNFVGSPLNQYFGLELAGGATVLTLDGAGYPLLEGFQIPNSTAMLRRDVTPFAMTDFAIGPSSIAFKKGGAWRRPISRVGPVGTDVVFLGEGALHQTRAVLTRCRLRAANGTRKEFAWRFEPKPMGS